MPGKPNIVFVFADQMRAQATGYANDPNVRTPFLDRLSQQSMNFCNAISGCPVCSPYRASLLTGQRPLTHGVFTNDVHLNDEAVSIADVYKQAGYDTAYIGKWHLDGRGRSSFIPRQSRHGFDYFKALECTHYYNDSYYYSGDNPSKLKWQGYDAIAQTRSAQEYLRQHTENKPFLLFLSWGPPHEPYDTAPEEFRRLYKPEDIKLRDNVPEQFFEKEHKFLKRYFGAAFDMNAPCSAQARKDLAGYYAHITALDHCLEQLDKTLQDCNLAENTIFVFTSDHGDMVGSHSRWDKQVPHDESIRVPFLLRFPRDFGYCGKQIESLILAEDIMPTLLGLCDIPIPKTVEGLNYAQQIRGENTPPDQAALLYSVMPFSRSYSRNVGGREYRGLRTLRYTYVKDLNGPWLLYDNQGDPYQMENLINKDHLSPIQADLDKLLTAKLRETDDAFLPAEHYISKWGYVVDETGTVPFRTDHN